MTYHVYLLHCADDKIYTGMTRDLPRRMYEHEQGLLVDAYTYTRRPVELKRAFDFERKQDAAEFEHRVKNWRREKKWVLIEEGMEGVKRMGKRKPPAEE